ncbi:unnamed protein product [Litomosoides sigmodontis]|uniref:Uncharacterized protein n=1 Tax=Litomosoides sigmodontis TaxID=42156 RepID=A0A3P6UA04_LITSI|nr:unnamed protein product [Litomosoides sigmodontis]
MNRAEVNMANDEYQLQHGYYEIENVPPFLSRLEILKQSGDKENTRCGKNTAWGRRNERENVGGRRTDKPIQTTFICLQWADIVSGGNYSSPDTVCLAINRKASEVISQLRCFCLYFIP